MSFCCHKFTPKDLYTFSITSETETWPKQLRFQNWILRNLKVPPGNSMGSKCWALAINSIWNLYLAAYICSQQNKNYGFSFVCKDKMLQDKALCCGFRDQVIPSKFDYFRKFNKKCDLNLKFTPCLFFWRLSPSDWCPTLGQSSPPCLCWNVQAPAAGVQTSRVPHLLAADGKC